MIRKNVEDKMEGTQVSRNEDYFQKQKSDNQHEKALERGNRFIP